MRSMWLFRKPQEEVGTAPQRDAGIGTMAFRLRVEFEIFRAPKADREVFYRDR